MSIDQAGVAPGLQGQKADEPKKVHMRCKNRNCNSIEAVEIFLPHNTGRHMYQCVSSHTSWGVATGGPIDLG
jgi:hypothetical protein